LGRGVVAPNAARGGTVSNDKSRYRFIGRARTGPDNQACDAARAFDRTA